jgi:hypothetical protein
VNDAEALFPVQPILEGIRKGDDFDLCVFVGQIAKPEAASPASDDSHFDGGENLL